MATVSIPLSPQTPKSPLICLTYSIPKNMNVAVEGAISTPSRADSPATVLPPDETLIEILHWLPTAKDCVAWELTCRRLHKVIHQDVTVLPRLVQSRGIPPKISTWEQLAWYERLCQYNLLKENRIGFALGSTEIRDPGGDENDSKIRGNIERIANVRALMKEFPRMRVTVDIYCGSYPFSGDLSLISQRMNAVWKALTRHNYSLARRTTMSSWWGPTTSRQGALVPPTHPYATLARRGNGWVLLRLELDGIELPELPDFYNYGGWGEFLNSSLRRYRR